MLAGRRSCGQVLGRAACYYRRHPTLAPTAPALQTALLSTGRRQRAEHGSPRPQGAAEAAWVGLAALLAGGAGLAGVAALDGPQPAADAKKSAEPVPDVKVARQHASRELKSEYEYVILGAGTTAYAAIESIYSNEPDADILIISNEASLPQPDSDRHHSLSPSLLHSYNEWRRHITDKLEAEPDSYSSAPMTVLLNEDKEMRLDVDKSRIMFEDGSHISYKRCLIANAGRPRGGVDKSNMPRSLRDRINMCGTLEDFYKLDHLHNIMANKNVAIVGGGFLATELALALSAKGRETGMQVSQIYAEKAPLARYLPLYLGLHVQRLMHGAGVRGISERLVTDVKESKSGSDGWLNMSLMGWNKETLHPDYAVLVAWNGVAWLGPVAPAQVDPCVEVGVKSGLEIDPANGGIVVNQQLEAVANVFVAGGAASYYDSALGRRRVEMFDHSINSGILAGFNMSVTDDRHRRRYLHQPMFQSHMKDIDVVATAVGEINSKMHTVGIWVNNRKEEQDEELDYQRGIIYYLENNKLKGILLWNAQENVERAREVLRQQPTINSTEALKRQIALAPDSWLRVIET